MPEKNFEERLRRYAGTFHPVVPYKKGDPLLRMDFTENNQELTEEILKDTQRFTDWVNSKLRAAGAKYGIGGYGEHRTIYSRSAVFDKAHRVAASASPSENPNEDEPRRLHLGVDIWGKPYTRVMAPLDGIVHSFAFNNAYGDYGATIILSHQTGGLCFHSLYGHLSLNSIKNLNEGELIKKGDAFAEFGIPFENGQWPPHLHFQLIIDLQGMKGDYPGVCRYSEREAYLKNCPDPELVLQMTGGEGEA